MEPYVSIIVPVHNTGDYLRAAMGSIRAQALPHGLEIVLVDDASTDARTLELLGQFARDADCRLIRRPTSGGPAQARNEGIAAARGPWLGFLDADDILAPGSLADRLAAADRVPGASWISGSLAVFHDGEEPRPVRDFDMLRERGRPVGDGVYLLPKPTAALIESSMPPHVGSTLIRRDLLTRLGGFATDLHYGEEWFLWVKASLLADLVWIDKPLMHLRRGHESMMTNLARRAALLPRSRLKAYRDPALSRYRRQLRWRIAADYRQSAELYRQCGLCWLTVRRAAAALRWTPNSASTAKLLGRTLRELFTSAYDRKKRTSR